MQVIAITDVIPPPVRREFTDVYVGMELMDTDLHQIIRSNQGLSEEHCQVRRIQGFVFEAISSINNDSSHSFVVIAYFAVFLVSTASRTKIYSLCKHHSSRLKAQQPVVECKL